MEIKGLVLPVVLATFSLTGIMAAQSTMPNQNNSAPSQETATPEQNQGNMGEQGNNTAEPQQLIDPGVIYNAKSPGTWVGKSVTLKNVTVQDTNDSGNFWVGSDGHHRLLVVKSSSNLDLHALRLRKGDIVTVTGVIDAASDAMSQKTGAEKGSMRNAEKSSGVFLLANNVQIKSSTEH
jgi:hypothetical protein